MNLCDTKKVRFLLVFGFLTKLTVETDEKANETITGCGYRNRKGAGRQYSGARDDEALFGEFPWMLALFQVDKNKNETYTCGGSLIHPRIALTAAHCVENKTSTKFKVRAGAWDMELLVEILPYQDIEVQEIVTHPDYIPKALYNDISLLILKSQFQFSQHINVVCLPPQNFLVPEGERGFSSGWGRYNVSSEDLAVILKKIDLPIVPRPECEKKLRKTRFGPSYRMHDSFICAGGEEGKDTCNGDGGSPLVFPVEEDPDRYYQAGMVAWGVACRQKNIPGVYVNLAKFRNWIDEKLTERQIDVSSYQYIPRMD